MVTQIWAARKGGLGWNRKCPHRSFCTFVNFPVLGLELVGEEVAWLVHFPFTSPLPSLSKLPLSGTPSSL